MLTRSVKQGRDSNRSFQYVAGSYPRITSILASIRCFLKLAESITYYSSCLLESEPVSAAERDVQFWTNLFPPLKKLRNINIS
jgi:hypothetical protein